MFSTLREGAQSWRIYNIARLLHIAGHEVHLLQYVRKSTWERGACYRYAISDIPNSVIFVSSYNAHFKHLKELCNKQYELVYGNTHFGTFLSLLGKVKKVPIIFDMHGGLVEELLLINDKNYKNIFNYFIYKIIDTLDLSLSDRIICVSRKMIKYLNEIKNIPINKIKFVTNGVDLNFFKQIENEYTFKLKKQLKIEDNFVFGYIGGFQKYQGITNLMNAAIKINDPRIIFLIVGGHWNSIFRRHNIIFIPKIPYKLLPFYYSICDFLVLPRPKHLATEIAAPTKFAEYLAMGKPILSTNVGDPAEIVKQYKCGIIINNNDIENIINGVADLVSRSEREIKNMGRNARKAAENEFDWNKIKLNLYNIIDNI